MEVTYRDKIRNLLDEGKLEESLQLLEEYVQHNSSGDFPCKKDITYEFRHQFSRPGISSRVKQIERSNEKYANFFKRGNFHFRNVRLYKAFLNYTKAIESNPNCACAYYFRAIIYNFLLEVEMPTIVPLIMRGVTKTVIRNKCKWLIDKARQECDTAIKLDPDFADAYVQRTIYYPDQDYTNITLDIKKATELSAFFNDPVIHIACGDIFLKAREFEEAKKSYKKALEFSLDKESEQFLYLKSNLFLAEGLTAWKNKKYPEAKAKLRKSLEYSIVPDLRFPITIDGYVEIDIKFEKIIKESKSLKELRDGIKKIIEPLHASKQIHKRLDVSFSEDIDGLAKLIEAKTNALLEFYNILHWDILSHLNADKTLRNLELSRKIFLENGFEDAIKAINNIENLFIELRKYDNLSEIPKVEETILIGELNPLLFLDGESTRAFLIQRTTEILENQRKILELSTEIKKDVQTPSNIDNIVKQLQGRQPITKRRILWCFKDEKELSRKVIMDMFKQEYDSTDIPEERTVVYNLTELSSDKFSLLIRKGKGPNIRYELTDLGKEVLPTILRKGATDHRFRL